RLVGVDDRVVVPGLLVLGDDLALAALLAVPGLGGGPALLGLVLLGYVHSLAHSAVHFRTTEGGAGQPLIRVAQPGEHGLGPVHGLLALRGDVEVGRDAVAVDAAARGGAVVPDGQLGDGAAGELARHLHRALAEGARAHDDRTAAVLERTGEQLGRAHR